MANKSIIAADRRQAQENILETSTSQTSQSISMTDIVSEGEIKGLVNGGESIFFGEDSLFNNDEASFSSGFFRVTGTTGSTNVTLSGDTKQTITGGNRFLAIKNALVAQVSLSNGSALDSGSGTKFTLTASSAIFLTEFQHNTGVTFSFDERELLHGDGVFFLDTLSKGGLRGTISEINAAGTTCVFRCPDSDFEEFEGETSGTRTLLMDLYLKISDISSTAITLTANPPIAFSLAEFLITESVVTGTSGAIEAKYPGKQSSHFTLFVPVMNCPGTHPCQTKLNSSLPTLIFPLLQDEHLVLPCEELRPAGHITHDMFRPGSLDAVFSRHS